MSKRRGVLAPLLLALALPLPLAATTIGSELPRTWRPALLEAASQFDDAVVAGESECRPVPGRIAICSDSYGHGWLAVTQVWSSNGRAVQALVKLNDTYFALARFNTPEMKALVLRDALKRALASGITTASASFPPAMTAIEFDGPGQWGELVEGGSTSPSSTYRLDFGNGNTVTTYVTWVPIEE